MSKKLTAATGKQGISVPTTLPKGPLSVKEIHTILKDYAVSPMCSATRTLDQLEVLLITLRDVAHAAERNSEDYLGTRAKLKRLKALCEMGAYLAADQAEHLGRMKEGFADTHVPAIVEMLGGES